jgi:molybdopterin-guanine dinucleotide biosynthesis protein A
MACLSGAILIGGRSRRMGANKALLPLSPEGPCIVELVARVLRTVADDIILVGASDDRDTYDALGLCQIPDIVPAAGALGGIHAALGAARHEHTLVVGCDMPFLNPTLLHHMAALPRDYDALIPLVGRPQPLHAVYARSALPSIDAALAARRYRVTGWLARATVRIVPRATITAFDPALRSCFNVNTPDDLAFARRIAGVVTGANEDVVTP